MMRIIRFVADDGRVLCGQEQIDGSTTIVNDTLGVLGSTRAFIRLNQLRGMHAVVAEDDANMRELVCTVLEKAGCECTACVDGEEAVKAIERVQVDLVVSDIMMPGYNGYDVFSAAKARNPALPVLLITGFGYDPSHSLMRASQEGVQSVLYKPFTPQQLVEELLKVVDRSGESLVRALAATNERAAVSTVLPPIRPTNIICIGTNYASAGSSPAGSTPGEESLEVFMKPNSSLQAPGQPIRIPRFERKELKVDCEGELAVVIGRTAEGVTEAEALNYVLGYTIANDVTARHWQTPASRAPGAPLWMRGKGFDTFCPVGPVLVTADELDPADLTITTTVNGRIHQQGSTAQMIRAIPRLLSEISQRITLEAGTLLLTGCPPRQSSSGEVSFLKPGDEVVVEIESIGRLSNPVAAPLAQT